MKDEWLLAEPSLASESSPTITLLKEKNVLLGQLVSLTLPRDQPLLLPFDKLLPYFLIHSLQIYFLQSF